MSEQFYAGSTSQTIDLFLQDSSSTNGGGLTGLVFNTAGLVASYRKGATGARVAITLATQTVGGAWSSGGFVEVDATNMPGVYRFDIVDAMIDTSGFCTLYIHGAANLAPMTLRIDCRARAADVRSVNGVAATAADLDTDLTEILDRLGFLLARKAGAVADPQTATPAYSITRSGDTYTVTLSGVTSTGVRTAPSLVKT